MKEPLWQRKRVIWSTLVACGGTSSTLGASWHELRFEWATFLSLFDLNLGSDPIPLLDLTCLGLCKFLPAFLFRELFGHRERIFLDLRLESVILGELLLSLTNHLLSLGYGGLGFLAQLLEVSIHCGLHVVPSELTSAASCVGPEPMLLVWLSALISWQLLLKCLVLFRFISEAMLLSEPLRLAIHFSQEFLCRMLGYVFLYKVHRRGQLGLLDEVKIFS
jgi:hypothetical protein